MIDYTRSCIANLEAYKVAPPDYDIILNANENPYDFPKALKEEFCAAIMDTAMNRYPDASASELRHLLGQYTGINEDQIICGCGSDEIIAMINQSFVNPGDTVIAHSPSFSMYQIWSNIAGASFMAIPDKKDHYPDVEGIINCARLHNAKIIYLCNPNNPTGYLFPRHDIVQILEETNALVIVDEAYMEFKGESQVDLVNNYSNVLVLKTLSKAFGLASIRCGYCLGPQNLIDMMYKVKSPYNLNTLTQKAAIIALRHRRKLLGRIKTLNVERRKVYKALLELPIEHVYPTAANFIYFETAKGDAIDRAMKAKGILIKHFANPLPGDLTAVRLTIGTPDENHAVLSVLKEVFA